MKSLVVSLHDVSPLTQTLCESILAQLLELGVRQTSLLVIPNHHRQAPITQDSSFRSWLARKVDADHEPVLHGYFHQRQRKGDDSLFSRLTTEIYTAGEGEFFDLSAEEASDRLQSGLDARRRVRDCSPQVRLPVYDPVELCADFRTFRRGQIKVTGLEHSCQLACCDESRVESRLGDHYCSGAADSYRHSSSRCSASCGLAPDPPIGRRNEPEPGMRFL